jgi:hypothetical protein
MGDQLHTQLHAGSRQLDGAEFHKRKPSFVVDVHVDDERAALRRRTTQSTRDDVIEKVFYFLKAQIDWKQGAGTTTKTADPKRDQPTFSSTRPSPPT